MKALELAMAVWAWLQSPAGVALLVALLSISEMLDAIPQVKASSLWKLAYGGLKALKEKIKPSLPKA